MIAAEITLILLRELLRAVVFPLRILLYLPVRKAWKRRAREMLAAPPAGPDTATGDLQAFVKGRRLGSGHIFMSVGETSAENLALRLMQSVESSDHHARWSCFGGKRMGAAGAEVLYPLSDRAIMGFVAALQSLPFFMRAVARFLRMLRDDPPDLVVLVDYPGLHMILGQAARRRGIPVLHYVAPQLWGWAPWRLNRYRKCVDATLTILPFEPAFFRGVGIHCEYIGHPLLERAVQPEHAASDERPLLCLLPGSRRGEIRLHLPAMIDVARELRQQTPDLHAVVPHTDPRRAALIQEILDTHGADFVDFHHGPLQGWLRDARLVIAKSGTGSLEACFAGTPTIIVYRFSSPLWMIFYPSCLNVPFFGAANLVAGREVVPEFGFANAAGWSQVTAAAAALMADGKARQACLDGLREVRARMGGAGASERAAKWVLPFCRIRQHQQDA
ncbi:MAG: lipid-A-disaccharide synthase [Planctomycetota bacterium]|jgi:lipid-A-disaccharide synthase